MSLTTRFQSGLLRTRLLFQTVGLMLLLLVGVALMIWRDSRHELDELFDAHLAHAAAILVTQQAGAIEPDDSDTDEDGMPDVDTPLLHKYSPRVAYQVFHKGRLVHHSANVGHLPMSEHTNGFSTQVLEDSKQWRVFATRGASQDDLIFVAEQIDSREDVMYAILQGLIGPFLIALLVLSAGLWVGIRNGLAPLDRIRAQLTQRNPKSTEPLKLGQVPGEVAPMVMAIEDALAQLRAKLASEERFTGDAAHELRTPVAAIKTHAQVGLGALDTQPDVVRAALKDVMSGCDRASRVIEQLLALARLDSSKFQQRQRFNVSDAVALVASELAPAGLAKRQLLEVILPEDFTCSVTQSRALVEVLLRNLIDNAARYAPEGGRISIQVARVSSSNIEVRIEDSGAGMSDADLLRLGERFFRVLGSDQPGSGLGWSIVKRICEHENLVVKAERSALLGGLCVSVRFVLTE